MSKEKADMGGSLRKYRCVKCYHQDTGRISFFETNRDDQWNIIYTKKYYYDSEPSGRGTGLTFRNQYDIESRKWIVTDTACKFCIHSKPDRESWIFHPDGLS